jgi:CheY-like chemotaxis protein
VPNGRQAIEYLQQHEQPDIVLMDMNMPEMDGPETIRSHPALKHLRMYGVSGMEVEDSGVEVGETGVNRWFTKPVDARRLVDELNNELKAKQRQQLVN